jgi:uncharacterized protein YbjT (DUF2867 family)
MKIVVIGGGGLIGTKLVRKLRDLGHDVDVVAASPASGVDTAAGADLREGLHDAQMVIDVTNSPSFDDKAVLRFFEASGRDTLAAQSGAGTRKSQPVDSGFQFSTVEWPRFATRG